MMTKIIVKSSNKHLKLDLFLDGTFQPRWTFHFKKAEPADFIETQFWEDTDISIRTKNF